MTDPNEPLTGRITTGTANAIDTDAPVIVPGGTPATDALALSPKVIRWGLIMLGAEMKRRGLIEDATANDIVSYGLMGVPLIWALIVGRMSLKTKQQLADLLPDYKARVARR